MQESDVPQGDRYVVNEFEDGNTWSILDTETHLVYALMLTRLSNFIFQIDLVELLPHGSSTRYLSYLREIMCARVEMSDPRSAPELVNFILGELEEADVANPIDIATQLGADLHGQRVEWPTLKNMT